jgi:hypothetical protein
VTTRMLAGIASETSPEPPEGLGPDTGRFVKSILVLEGSEMDSPRKEAVLKAADNWLRALEALVAKRKTAEGAEAREEAADLASVELVVAVKSWRLERGPS